jgi:hypothetical protein
MSNDFDWKLVQKGIDLTYKKTYSNKIFKKFVMFISDGRTVSRTFSAMPVSSRRYLFLLGWVAKYIRSFPKSLQTPVKSVA